MVESHVYLWGVDGKDGDERYDGGNKDGTHELLVF